MWEFLIKYRNALWGFFFGLTIMVLGGLSLTMPSIISMPLFLLCFVKLYNKELLFDYSFDYAVIGYWTGMLMLLLIPIAPIFIMDNFILRCIVGGIIMYIICNDSIADFNERLGLAFLLGILQPLTPTILISAVWFGILSFEYCALGALIFGCSALVCHKVLK